ncbi:DUF192 domain-containing protein [Allopontixanthobacter sediminis]|uniref:DUF192 domain-containing protein n=1 Tax=Allopontixanthobacter sediminis TaxID=1689985 RepID=A0A845B459_9SPHN|nr:DUF192 domain-containing protein [Allopontixanthobacter sediminis]MXP44924.1 DUF192 domain-containing protein [Allopontixanthobacter sediminis]
MIRSFAIAAGVFLFAACSPQQSAEGAPAAAAAETAVHPVSGLAVVPLTVSDGKKVHRFRVEVAATPLDQAKGLMFRTEMGPNEGMIFPRDGYSQASFWMKNTPLPLDIIFIGTDGRISNIAANTVPYSLESVTSDGLASAVLELNAGRAAELGIVPGNKVEW